VINEAQTDIDSGENALLASGITGDMRAAQYRRFDEAKRRADAAWKVYEPLISDGEEMTLWREFVPAWQAWWRDHEEFVRLARAYEQKGDAAAYEAMKNHALVTIGVTFAKATDLLNKLTDLNTEGARLATAQAASQAAWLRLISLGITAVGVVLALVVGFVMSGRISRPLVSAVAVLQKVAQGDFTGRLNLDTKDELGQMATALNTAIEEMREALRGVRETAASVASSSDQLASASQEISSGAQEQASSLEETAASLEEMTATIKQNADNAQQASQLAGGARSTAEEGGQVVSEAVQAMSAINESSKKIADIITTIDEIAFQTNLLALNAAVEAARAGEQGRGFAVVAAEVRNLAQRSATAAKEIKDLISDSTRKVDAGSALVNASGKTLNDIVAAVKRVTDIVAEIAAASREQAAGIEQVNKAVTQMDQVTQANASQTEEMSGTSESLSGEAAKLQSLVRKFTLGDETVQDASRPAPRRPVAIVSRKAAAPAPPRRTPPVQGTAALALESEFQEF